MKLLNKLKKKLPVSRKEYDREVTESRHHEVLMDQYTRMCSKLEHEAKVARRERDVARKEATNVRATVSSFVGGVRTVRLDREDFISVMHFNNEFDYTEENILGALEAMRAQVMSETQGAVATAKKIRDSKRLQEEAEAKKLK